MASFADPAILGRGLENFVSNFLQDRYLTLGNPPQGAAIGILLLVIVSLGTALILALGRPRTRRSAMRRIRVAGVITGCALIPLLVPTALVLLASLSKGEVLTFPTAWSHHSLVRCDARNHAVWRALGNSLYVAILSVVINLLCGVPAALALPKVGRYSKVLFTVLLSLGLSAPTIVSAFAYFDIYSRIGVGSHLTPVALAIAVTSFPFMLWTVLAAYRRPGSRAPPRRGDDGYRSCGAAALRPLTSARLLES